MLVWRFELEFNSKQLNIGRDDQSEGYKTNRQK